MKLVISLPPANISTMPQLWPPRLPVDITALEEDGEVITTFDNYAFRYDIEVITAEVNGLKEKPSEIFLWATLESYPHLENYVNRFPYAKIIGLPRWYNDKFHVVDLYTEPMPTPNIATVAIPYWLNSKLAYTSESLQAQKFAVIDFNYYEKMVPQRRMAEILRTMRLRYCIDFLVIKTDMTFRRGLTLAFIDQLEDMEMSRLIPFMCMGDVKGVDPGFLKALREAGCVAIDFGSIDVTQLATEPFQWRLPAAVETCRQIGITPLITPTIGLPTTTIDDVINATRLLKTYNLLTDVKPVGVERFELVSAHSDEDILVELANGTYNGTDWDDAFLYGLMHLMSMGDIERLEELRS